MAVTESFRKFRGRLRSALRSQYEAVAEIATPRKGSSKLRTPSCRPPERRAGMRMGAWRAKPVTRSSQRCRGPATGRGLGKAGAGKQTRITAGGGATARCARMRLCLILHQGASPLRPPAPFPWTTDSVGREAVRQGYAAPAKSAALDELPLSPGTQLGRGKGGLKAGPPFRWVGSRNELNSRIGRSVS